MFAWFQSLMPHEEKFFDFFERHAQTLVDGSAALRDLVQPGADIEACAQRINKFEDAADDITREVMLAVRRTFITPFDRSDIQDLTASMDDAIDQMKQTAKAVLLFEVKQFEAPMREMAEIIVKSAEITVDAIGALRHMKKNSSRLMAMTVKITRLEEDSDTLHDNGLKELFRAHRASDPMGYIVGAEIYGHLEKVVDRFEDVANRINSIVIEHL
jgi:predicted phosphate transport protein (TIGR00153 family)